MQASPLRIHLAPFEITDFLFSHFTELLSESHTYFRSLLLPIPDPVTTGRFDRKCGEVDLDKFDPAAASTGLESELSNHVDLV